MWIRFLCNWQALAFLSCDILQVFSLEVYVGWFRHYTDSHVGVLNEAGEAHFRTYLVMFHVIPRFEFGLNIVHLCQYLSTHSASCGIVNRTIHYSCPGSARGNRQMLCYRTYLLVDSESSSSRSFESSLKSALLWYVVLITTQQYRVLFPKRLAWCSNEDSISSLINLNIVM